MLRRILVLIGWLVAVQATGTALYAQQGVVATGGDGSSPGGAVSYSIGQVAYSAGSSPGGSVSMGNQQPFEIFVLSTKPAAQIKLECAVYPNPTVGLLTLRIEEKVPRQMTWYLHSLSGRLLASQAVEGAVTTIPLTQYPAGTYMFTIRGSEQELKTFKIIKH